MKEWAKPFYNSKSWKTCRKSYIDKRVQLDGGLCEVCHDRCGYIVHHKLMLTPMNIDDADVTLNHCNLQYVCKDCHDAIEGHWYQSKQEFEPLVKFDFKGNPIPNDNR